VTPRPTADQPLEPLRLQPWNGPLYAERFGLQGDRLVFVHGFTQTGRSWLPVATAFAREYDVMLVDAPGHAGSVGVRADLRRTADLLGQTGGTGTYIGYSMGGRMCLHLALTHPYLVPRLVLLSTTAGIADELERSERRDRDDALADSIEADGVAPFLDRWIAQPIFEGLAITESEREDRLRNTSEGLASSLRMAGTGTQDPLWPRLKELTMPVLIIAGERDTKFIDIGRQLAAGIQRSRLVTVPGAGHAVHFEQPIVTAELIADFLRS
jgi:2-succinyl-6-hydroxy-2,4-cyclohexadiene-1-carboxylate synthase